jgi:hypothetical protein
MEMGLPWHNMGTKKHSEEADLPLIQSPNQIVNENEQTTEAFSWNVPALSCSSVHPPPLLNKESIKHPEHAFPFAFQIQVQEIASKVKIRLSRLQETSGQGELLVILGFVVSLLSLLYQTRLSRLYLWRTLFMFSWMDWNVYVSL